MNKQFLIVVFVVIGITTSSWAGMYRWVDEDGNTVYSQHAPPGAIESTVIKPPPPPAVDPEEAQKKLNQTMQKLDDASEDRELTRKKQEEEQKASATRETNCAHARHNLENLLTRVRALVRTSDGEYVRLTEEERQKRIQEAKEQVSKNCK